MSQGRRDTFRFSIMASRKEAELNKLIFTKTSRDHYESLCRLDILGLIGNVRDDITVHQDLKDQLRKNKDGWCKTGLIWKNNSTLLQNNQLASLATSEGVVEKSIMKQILASKNSIYHTG